MPIRISDYTWRQTLERVTLTLNLHHTSPKKLDVVTTGSYLKVSSWGELFCLLGRLLKLSMSVEESEGGLFVVAVIPEWGKIN